MKFNTSLKLGTKPQSTRISTSTTKFNIARNDPQFVRFQQNSYISQNYKPFSSNTQEPRRVNYGSSWTSLNASPFVLGTAALIAMGSMYAFSQYETKAEAQKKDNEEEEEDEEKIVENAGKWKEGLPVITRSEVAKHNSKETGIWVTFREGVYDVTEFIEQHPGQEKILLASGGSLEPFWGMYRQHYHSTVVRILEEYRIGNLSKTDQVAAAAVDPNDPYANDPQDRHPSLIVRSKKPMNAEVPPALIAESRLTPNELFFIRNHLPVPKVDTSKYFIEITSDTQKEPIRISLDDLKSKFQHQTVEVTIQCAGNRRNEMSRLKEVKGGFWDIGAISNANWTGVPLRDVLLWAGIDPEKANLQHVQFVGLDKDFEKSYGASIPVDKAYSPYGDVILAFQMNGQDIPLDHGYPVRAVVPGVIGARQVKWLSKIHVSKYESPSHWQQKDYKGFPPNIDWHNVNWDAAPAIQEYPVQSAICTPRDGSTLPKETTTIPVKGFAWSGGGRGIIRVDVSVDGGQTWQTAELDKPNQQDNRVWAWTLWKAEVPVPKDFKGKLDITCRAVDSSYNTQPERVEPIWNLRGVLSNAWHHVKVEVPPK